MMPQKKQYQTQKREYEKKNKIKRKMTTFNLM